LCAVLKTPTRLVQSIEGGHAEFCKQLKWMLEEEEEKTRMESVRNDGMVNK
jgi:hypothetical protein